MPDERAPALTGLRIADPPERWRALGFAVAADGRLDLGAVQLRVGVPGRGIVAWTVTGAPGLGEALGLRGTPGREPGIDAAPDPAAGDHPNGATGLDHIVVTVPDFDATARRLKDAGQPFRRVRQASEIVRQGFRRLGPVILEVVEATDTRAPAFWGLVAIVPDLDALASLAAPHVKSPRTAVQPGRRIAPVSRSAGLSTQLAFMDPEPSGPDPAPS